MSNFHFITQASPNFRCLQLRQVKPRGQRFSGVFLFRSVSGAVVRPMFYGQEVKPMCIILSSPRNHLTKTYSLTVHNLGEDLLMTWTDRR